MSTKPKKNNEDNEDIHPDHVPLIPYDTQKEKEKEQQRKFIEKLRQEGGKYEAVVTTKEGITKKASELILKEQEEEFLKCATDPIHFIETYLTIFDQTKGLEGEIVPFKLFDFQKKLVNEYLNNKSVVANKYRQAGISTTTCAYIAWYISFKKNRQVAIVANRLEMASGEIMADVVTFINSLPDFLRPKTGRVGNKTYKDTQK